ncbi:MAG: redoxin family protein [Desulforhopalus sp.]
MQKHILFYAAVLSLVFLLSSCASKQAPLAIDTSSSVPGTQVAKKGEILALVGTGIEVGQRLPDNSLVDAATMKPINLHDYMGSVLFLSIVPSIDTKVCEAQTHYLGEEGDILPPTVKRITISRDTPFAQARFAKEAKLEDVQYLSDYKEGAFGRSIGLLLDGPRLLARSVILVDKQGVVRYIQVVPDITHLPDMEEAFARATALANAP